MRKPARDELERVKKAAESLINQPNRLTEGEYLLLQMIGSLVLIIEDMDASKSDNLGAWFGGGL